MGSKLFFSYSGNMAPHEKQEAAARDVPLTSNSSPDYESDQAVNASGHVQELNRNFSLVSLAGVGLVVGSVWPAAGGSIVVALYNGGPPGSKTPNVWLTESANILQVSCTSSFSSPSSIGLSQLVSPS